MYNPETKNQYSPMFNQPTFKDPSLYPYGNYGTNPQIKTQGMAPAAAAAPGGGAMLSVPEVGIHTLNAVKSFRKSSGTGPTEGGYGQPPAPGGNMLGKVGVAGDLAGLAIQGISAVQARKDARMAQKRADERYRREQERLDQLDAERRDQMRRSNEMAYGQYGMDIEQQAQDLYGTYR